MISSQNECFDIMKEESFAVLHFRLIFAKYSVCVSVHGCSATIAAKSIVWLFFSLFDMQFCCIFTLSLMHCALDSIKAKSHEKMVSFDHCK